jgi:hypothetical protein
MQKNKSLTLRRDKILATTDNGCNYFLKRFPELWMQIKYGRRVNLNSEFHDQQGTLSVYFNTNKNKWFFKDHAGKETYGDMFTYAALVNKLDFQKDFSRILTVVENEMKDFAPPSLNTYKILNNETGEYITFII